MFPSRICAAIVLIFSVPTLGKTIWRPRQLNFIENDMVRNMDTSICKRLSNRFAALSKPPFGLCEIAENAHGKHDMLVLGDSYAINLGPVVYEAFQEHAKEFNILAMKGCDVLVEQQKPACNVKVDYEDLLKTLKPQVIFILQRHVQAKKTHDITVEDDKIYHDQLAALKRMEEVADKIYILQAIPSLNRGNYDQIYSVKSTRELKGRLIKYDDYPARQRIQDLKVNCTKCEIVDIKPLLLTKDNRYWGYNDETDLLYIDQWNNFTRFAKERISQVFRELARKFARS
ncbi:hypothetical protein GCK32_001976 [Trichostrongylus colubriformis]|uniref:SGNH domain-containing protein n=1 Tax=Trichostrongylus colubriformis TaxID=6319 RepID=A0AAN8FJU6_TRICO